MSQFTFVTIVDSKVVMTLGIWTVDYFYKIDGSKWSGWNWATQSVTGAKNAGYLEDLTLRSFEGSFGTLENFSINSERGVPCGLRVSASRVYNLVVAYRNVDKPVPFSPQLLMPAPRANPNSGAGTVKQLQTQTIQQFDQLQMNQNAIDYVNQINR